MSGQDLVNFIFLIIEKIIEFGSTLFDFINTTFTIGDFTFRVLDAFGITFIALMTLRLVKKFLPVA